MREQYVCQRQYREIITYELFVINGHGLPESNLEGVIM